MNKKIKENKEQEKEEKRWAKAKKAYGIVHKNIYCNIQSTNIQRILNLFNLAYSG